MSDRATRAALARNDAFLAVAVEGLDLCPFARVCRSSKRLWRALSWAEGDDADDAIDAALLALEAESAAAGDAAPEVALLLLPGLATLSAAAFDAVHAAARERYERKARAFYVVAFHPGYAVDDRTPHTLVRAFRRSPDPTLQLVRKDVLAALRRPADEAERVRTANQLLHDGADLDTLAAALTAARDVSERVAIANHRRFAAERDAIVALFDALIARSAAERAALGPGHAPLAWTVVGGGAGAHGGEDA